MDVQALIEQAGAYMPPADLDTLRRAYQWMLDVRAERGRSVSEAQIQHGLNVAARLVELGQEAATVIAGMVNQVVENGLVRRADLELALGFDVAQMVDGLIKLTEVDENVQDHSRYHSKREAEVLRRMIVAVIKDPRVVLIKLADRLHTMRTLWAIQDTGLRRQIAQETLDTFAPLAGRLGIYRFKWEMEDLAFREIGPDAYNAIAQDLDESRQEQEQQIEKFIVRIKEALQTVGIDEAAVVGRPKHIYSIYRKMERKSLTFDRIRDLRAIRIIVKTRLECYDALGVVHNLWRPIPGGFDDYISSPKDNSYQSLHTDVMAEDGKPLEIQIRTSEMHQVAEQGIAAHWRYKESRHQLGEKAVDARIQWFRSVLTSPREEEPPTFEEMLKAQGDNIKDLVYVFTPKGEAIELHLGATPIDFAYAIHTDVGHRCRGAKVNGRLVSLNYALQNGDRVQILTIKSGGPSRDWLNPELGFTRTPRARQKINQWFRRQAYEQNVEQGRVLLGKELRRLNLDLTAQDAALLLRKDNSEDFLAKVGAGDIQLSTVATRLIEILLASKKDDGLLAVRPEKLTKQDTGIQVKNVGNLLTNLARCCHPVPPDQIIGYITRGRGVTIHRRDCVNVSRNVEPERLIQVSWGKEVMNYPVQVRVRAYDRPGLSRDIGIALDSQDVPIIHARTDSTKGKNLVTFTMTLLITGDPQLVRMLNELEKVPNVTAVQRVTR